MKDKNVIFFQSDLKLSTKKTSGFLPLLSQSVETKQKSKSTERGSFVSSLKFELFPSASVPSFPLDPLSVSPHPSSPEIEIRIPEARTDYSSSSPVR